MPVADSTRQTARPGASLRDLLEARGAFAIDAAQPLPIGRLALFLSLGGGLFGAVMGSLAGRWLGGLYSATKVPLLVVGATLLCLPSFFVLNSLLGLRSDFRAALRGILAAQGTVALSLAACAPILTVAYISSSDYPAALLVNGALFAVSAYAGQSTLRRHYAPLIVENRRHRIALVAWAVLYVFVGIKLGWILRPFVGDPALPLEFLRAEQWMEDPYAVLFWTAVALAARLLGLA